MAQWNYKNEYYYIHYAKQWFIIILCFIAARWSGLISVFIHIEIRIFYIVLNRSIDFFIGWFVGVFLWNREDIRRNVEDIFFSLVLFCCFVSYVIFRYHCLLVISSSCIRYILISFVWLFLKAFFHCFWI